MDWNATLMWLKKSVAIIDDMLKILDITRLRYIYIYIFIYLCMYVCMNIKRDLDLN